ncbi:hypothetical protein [Secundilactobacillus similis]|uniref:hypothetical protein n=1 Tax=Secundilactobacillus similis TaxID=414682 RepID=UPI000A60AB11|nr:hypothetical protein [Secundilactobacillus similis]
MTYYSAKICFLLAQNARDEHRSETEVVDHLNDAKTFAKLNNNTQLLAKIAAFQG